MTAGTGLPGTLVVEVLTEALPGAGPQGDTIDQCCERDSDGLPYLNGGRVRACLRAAALARAHLWDEAALRAALEVLPPEGALEPGVVAGFTARVRDPERSALLAALRHDSLTSARALRMLTVDRARTAVDRHGGPLRGSLRTERRVRPAVVFVATLRWSGRATERHGTVLARAALAWRQVGAGECDGLGRIRAHLDDRDTTLTLARRTIDCPGEEQPW